MVETLLINDTLTEVMVYMATIIMGVQKYVKCMMFNIIAMMVVIIINQI